jgi:hypothetical protein
MWMRKVFQKGASMFEQTGLKVRDICALPAEKHCDECFEEPDCNKCDEIMVCDWNKYNRTLSEVSSLPVDEQKLRDAGFVRCPSTPEIWDIVVKGLQFKNLVGGANRERVADEIAESLREYMMKGL